MTKTVEQRARARAHEMNRRARKAGAAGRMSMTDLLPLFKEPTECRWCGARLDFMVPTRYGLGRSTLDHVVPLGRGGGGGIDNIVPACWACNALRAMIDHGGCDARQLWCKASAYRRAHVSFVVEALAPFEGYR